MKLTYDIHIHTELSDCAERDATVENYIAAAKRDGVTALGFSDHLWDDTVTEPTNWYRPQNVAHVTQLKNTLPESREIDGIKLFFGCETEFIGNGTLCLSEKHMDLFDYILVPHSHTHMNAVMPREYQADHRLHANFLMESFLRLIRHPQADRITAVAHPFAPGTKHENFNAVQSLIPDSYFYEAFSEAKEKGIAMEINGSCLTYLPDREIPFCEYVRIYSIAKECGCRFTYGSDSHDFRFARKLELIEDFFAQCGITDRDMLTLENIKRR